MSISNPSTGSIIRLGAPYFNARPLVWSFVEPPSPDVVLVEETPARLADSLRAGRLDAALISSVEAYRDESLEVLPGVGVTSRGPVWSIKLFHKKPLAEVTSVALDTSSRTSSALTRVLLAQRYGNHPEWVHLLPDLDAMLEACDAALLIGDPGLRAAHPTVPYVDLGAEWFAWTGLPFVFAVWAARPGFFEGGFGARLRRAAEEGPSRVDAIVADEAPRRGIPPAVAREYLSRIIRYRVGPDEEAGLRLFLRYVA